MPTLDTLLSGSPITWLLLLASLLVGLSKGGLPAVGMVSVPLLSLVMSPVLAAVLLLPIYILSDIVSVWLYRKDFSAPNLKILIPAGLLGVFVGWATASYVSDLAVTLLIGLIGVGFCLNIWLHRSANQHPRPVNAAKGLFWGTLAGFTSFVSHAGAPPYQVYILPQKLPKLVFAGTSTILFAVINLAKVVPYSNLHPYADSTLAVSAGLVPIAIVGTVLGRYLTQKLSEKWFYLAVQLALFAISLKLVYNGVLGLLGAG